MIESTPWSISADVDENPLDLMGNARRILPPAIEQTDPDLSPLPPPDPDKTLIEQPVSSGASTIIEAPSAAANKATERLPEIHEATPFLLLWPGEAYERRFEVETPFTYIGRVPGNQLLLDDTGMSRHHARIAKEGTAYILYDQNSTNGTFVYNGRDQKWVPITRHELRDGTDIRVGRTPMRFTLILTEQ